MLGKSTQSTFSRTGGDLYLVFRVVSGSDNWIPAGKMVDPVGFHSEHLAFPQSAGIESTDADA